MDGKLMENSETDKVLEENIREKLLYMGLGNDVLEMAQKSQAMEAKVNRQNYIKLKSFLTAKERISKMRE